MPALVFSALNGLPGLTCVNANGTNLLATTTTTQARPFMFTAVYSRTANNAGGIFETVNGTGAGTGIRGGGSANQSAGENNNAQVVVGTANDNSFHAVQATNPSSGNGLINIDNVETSGTTAGADMSATQLRLCRNANAVSATATIMEVNLYPSIPNSTNRTALNTNMHDATSGYNF
jgi:hypothetical protein